MLGNLSELMRMANSVTEEQTNKAMGMIDVVLALPAQIQNVHQTQMRIEQKLDSLLKELEHDDGQGN